ncbi:AI-2E family transporter [Clostridium baratii]|uniref:Permease n=1 Tax=Clostridium baratii TaxID=1561 RepID=A0A174QZF3_9CLOT|nr:AI-2E family transporter [Clostridium baratii]CUP77087.1 permease [Clostridium baratii]
MKFKFLTRELIIKIIIALIFIILFIAYLNSSIFREIINLILISAILAYVLKPLRDSITRKLKITKRKATLIVMLSICLIIALIFIILIPKLVRELGNSVYMIEDFSNYIKEFKSNIKFLDKSPIVSTVYDDIEVKFWGYIMELSRNLINWIIEFANNLIAIAIIPIISYYFLSDGEKISNKMYLLIPKEKRTVTKRIIEDINLLLERYIVSQIILSIATGIMCLILFIGIDLRFAILLSIINAIFNIVPYFGAFFGGIPAVIVGFMDSPTKALWTVIGILVIQQIEGNILAPKVTADSTNIHPLVIIILLLIGEKMFGVFGMIMAVPLGVIIKVIYDDLNYYLF